MIIRCAVCSKPVDRWSTEYDPRTTRVRICYDKDEIFLIYEPNDLEALINVCKAAIGAAR